MTQNNAAEAASADLAKLIADALTANRNTAAAAPAAAATVTPPVAAAAAPTEPKPDAVATAVQASLDRVFAVLECDEAKDHLPQAIALAKAGLTAAQAKTILGTLPKVEAAAPKKDALGDALATQMARRDNSANVTPAPEAAAAKGEGDAFVNFMASRHKKPAAA